MQAENTVSLANWPLSCFTPHLETQNPLCELPPVADLELGLNTSTNFE
jgi:hypothetical protein